MFKDIDADCYLMIDGDDTYPAESAREMCEYIIKKQADMVILYDSNAAECFDILSKKAQLLYFSAISTGLFFFAH